MQYRLHCRDSPSHIGATHKQDVIASYFSARRAPPILTFRLEGATHMHLTLLGEFFLAIKAYNGSSSAVRFFFVHLYTLFWRDASIQQSFKSARVIPKPGLSDYYHSSSNLKSKHSRNLSRDRTPSSVQIIRRDLTQSFSRCP